MTAIRLHDKDEIERYLRSDPFLHLYALGDLDDFFWPYTTWYAHKDNSAQITQVALIYTVGDLPVILAFSEQPDEMCRLLLDIQPRLPNKFYAHLSANLVSALAGKYLIYEHGTLYKMGLTDYGRLASADEKYVVRRSSMNVLPLRVADLDAINELYRVSYPGNWFDPRMLETGCYYGIRSGRDIVSIAGVHVFSRRYRVAVLGNITTHPQYRGQGYAAATIAKLCRELSTNIDHIGLNVEVANAAAIACYEKLGFKHTATYHEYTLTTK